MERVGIKANEEKEKRSNEQLAHEREDARISGHFRAKLFLRDTPDFSGFPRPRVDTCPSVSLLHFDSRGRRAPGTEITTRTAVFIKPPPLRNQTANPPANFLPLSASSLIPVPSRNGWLSRES